MFEHGFTLLVDAITVIGNGVMQRREGDGTEHPPTEMPNGTVRFRALDGEDVHEAFNVGATPWRNIVVELKAQPPGPTGYVTNDV